MEVFHYVANELNGEPLFDSAVDKWQDTGSVYNDFDSASTSLMITSEECAEFSFSQKMTSSPAKTSTVITEAIDYAVMDADMHDGLLYEHLVWESSMFDNVSETCDDAYIKKVYNLVRDVDGCWSDLTVSEQAEKMFHRRFRANWEAPDTVYDAWVILRGWERPWFDNHRFNVLFPDILEEMKTPNPAKRKRRRLSIDELAGDTASGSGND